MCVPFIHVQEAAGCFQYLKDNEANKTDMPRPQDLAPDCVGMLEKLMLAQAQVGVRRLS